MSLSVTPSSVDTWDVGGAAIVPYVPPSVAPSPHPLHCEDTVVVESVLPLMSDSDGREERLSEERRLD